MTPLFIHGFGCGFRILAIVLLIGHSPPFVLAAAPAAAKGGPLHGTESKKRHYLATTAPSLLAESSSEDSKSSTADNLLSSEDDSNESTTTTAAFLRVTKRKTQDSPVVHSQGVTVRAPDADTRRYRHIHLRNGVEAMLAASDETSTKAAACVFVNGAGSMQDEDAVPGLAHLVEHMVFRGTRAHPESGAFGSFLAQHGGGYSAATNGNRVQFSFELNNEKDVAGSDNPLDRALFMFAQLLIPGEPLFLPEHIAQEVNMIESEFQLDAKKADKRLRFLLQSTRHFRGRRAGRFFAGNRESLLNGAAGRDSEYLAAKAKEFHSAHYSAGRIKLGVVGGSGVTLDELERMVARAFGNLKKLETDCAGTTPNLRGTLFSEDSESSQRHSIPDLRHTEQLVAPSTSQATLSFEFPVPYQPPHRTWQSRPTDLLRLIVAGEGRGSVLSVLKKQQLATGVDAGLKEVVDVEDGKKLSFFTIHVHLTEQADARGWPAVRAIGNVIFRFLGMLRAQLLDDDGPPRVDEEDNVFQQQFLDMQRVTAMHWRFGAPKGTLDLACTIAGALSQDFSETVPGERVTSVLMRNVLAPGPLDPNLLKDLLSAITVENVSLVRVSGTHAKECGEVEPVFGTLHSGVRAVADDSAWEAWRAAEGSSDDEMMGLRLPQPNPFLAENLEVKPMPSRSQEDENDVPSSVVVRIPVPDVEGMNHALDIGGANSRSPAWNFHLFHQQTTDTFLTPQVQVRLHIYSHWTARSVRNRLSTQVWAAGVVEALSEFAFEASLADLNFAVLPTPRGVIVSFSGFADKLVLLVRAVVEKMVAFKVGGGEQHAAGAEEGDSRIKHWTLLQDLARTDVIRSAALAGPFRSLGATTALGKASSLLERLVNRDARMVPEDLCVFDEDVAVEDVDRVNEKLFGVADFHAEGLVMGNIRIEEVEGLFARGFGEPLREWWRTRQHREDEWHARDDRGPAGETVSPDGPRRQLPRPVISATTVPAQHFFHPRPVISATTVPAQHFFRLHPGKSLHATMVNRGSERSGAALLAVQLPTMQVDEETAYHALLANLWLPTLKHEFYQELRTRQQLGYVVLGPELVARSGGVAWLVLAVQSEDYESGDCLARIEAFARQHLGGPGSRDALQALIPQKTFNRKKTELLRSLQTPKTPRSLSQAFDRNWSAVSARRNPVLPFAHGESVRKRNLELLEQGRLRDFEAFLSAVTSLYTSTTPTMKIELVAEGRWQEHQAKRSKEAKDDSGASTKIFADDLDGHPRVWDQLAAFFGNRVEFGHWGRWIASRSAVP